jgi:hypothetical protein
MEVKLSGTAAIQIKLTGVEWFDEILNTDEALNKAVQSFDLVNISVRMDELKVQYGIKNNITNLK